MGKKIKVAIYTAIFGGYDVLKAQPEQKDIECNWFCFTDDPKIKIEKDALDQWNIGLCKTQDIHPRMNAKRYRTHPFELFGSGKFGDYDFIVYMDGSGRLKSDTAIKYIIDQRTDQTDVICFAHPQRDCLFDEAKFTANAGMEKYKGLEKKLIEQSEHYRSLGMPEHFGLTATGMLVTQPNDKMEKIFDERYKECIKRTYQDQISFDYLMRKHKVNRQHIVLHQRGQTQFNNDLITFLIPHIRQD